MTGKHNDKMMVLLLFGCFVFLDLEYFKYKNVSSYRPGAPNEYLAHFVEVHV